MMSSRDKEAMHTSKEEGVTVASSSSRQWSSGLKNPRIVRVSRTFGGKDRHSKVCTIKGLRDRRIRLSVPTAIQLYDLQDRLGLGQPSKVIDWLLDNTKNDIDKLPPLPGLPGSFAPFQDHMHTTQGYGASMPFFDANFIPSRSVHVNEDPSIAPKLMYWDASATMRSKQKEIDDDVDVDVDDDDDDDQGGIGGSNSGSNSQVLAQNFFPIASGSNATTILPHSSLISNHPMYNYYHNWEPSNLSLTQFGGLGLSSQNDHHHHHHHQGNSSNNNDSSSLSSPLALSARSQLFLSPSSMASTSSVFPPHASYLSTNQPQLENDIRQLNRFHVSNHNPYISSPLYNNSSGLGLKPFPFSMSHHPQLHQNDQDHHHQQQHEKNHDGSWRDSSRN